MAAEPRAALGVCRDRQAKGRQQDCGHQGKKRQRDIVSCWKSWREGQHRDEMGGPDSKAGRGCANAEPDLLHVAVGAAHMMKQADGRDRCEHADHRGQSHEAKIVLVHDAAIYG